MLAVVQIVRGGRRVVEPELDVGAGDLLEAFDEGNQPLDGVILVQDAVDPEGHRQLGQQLVVGFDHVVLHVAGYVDAADLILVLFRERQNILFRNGLRYGKSRVDVHVVGAGHFVQHHLQGFQVGEGFAAGKDEIARGRDGIHHLDALADLFQGEAGHVGVFPFVYAERAVVIAIIGYEHGDGASALSGLVWSVHQCFLTMPEK